MGQSRMKWYRSIVLGMTVAGTLAGPAPVFAQSTTVQSYHCADGTNFIVGFFPYDKRAHLEDRWRGGDASQTPGLLGNVAMPAMA